MAAMRVRLALTAVYGALLGTWFYADQKQIDLYSQGVYDVLHSTAFGFTFALAFPILVGWLVGRWWVLGALIGPLASLGYLQASGYVSPWHDGAPPLGFPGWFGLFFLGALLLLGVGIRTGFIWRGVDPRPPVDPSDDWTWGK